MRIKSNNLVESISVLYFVIAFIEIASEFYAYELLIFYLKPLLPIILMVMYWFHSNQRQWIFFAALFFSSMTNIFFISNSQEMLFYGIIVFTFHRIFALVLILKLTRIKDYIPFAIATIPFLLIFFYLFIETTDIPENSFLIIILQNLLISAYAGVALSSYIMNDNKQNSILLISALLFVMLQFVVYIAKYYLANEYITIFRTLAMSLNVFAFYTFYRYVLSVESSNNN